MWLPVIRIPRLGPGDIDHAVNDGVSHVDALGAELTSQGLA